MIRKTIVAAAAVSVLTSGAYAMNGEVINIGVTVNGTAVEFEDQQPIILNDRTLLPVRGVMEALGKEVAWDSENSRAVISDASVSVSLGIGDAVMIKEVMADGLSVTENIELDSVPVIVNDRTLLPIRAVAEAFGAQVLWDSETSTVIING